MPDSKATYGVQPPYNPSYAPSCPPSYAEAVGAAGDAPLSTPKLYPPAMPPQMNPPPPAAVNVGPPYYAPAPQAVVATVITSVGPKPSRIQCPKCYAQVLTRTSSSCKQSAHIACFVLFFIGCFLCSCIPYCMNSFKVIQHYCPKCNAYIGSYRT